MKKITRVFDVEMRSQNEGSREVEGYAVVFNTITDWKT